MICTFTPVSGNGASSGSKSMIVARREWLNGGASAMFTMNGSSIGERYSPGTCGKRAGSMQNVGHMFAVLRRRDFRLLWLAQSTSGLGDRLVIVALALLVIEVPGSPPDLVLFPLGARLAALIFTGEVTVLRLLVIEALFGSAEAFFRPAATGLVPQTVPDEDIQPARAMVGLSENVAEFAGPALATALVLGAGAGWAFALDAATFLLSAAFLVQVRPRRRSVAAAARAGVSVWRDMRDGLREGRARAWVWATLAAFCAALFTALGPWFVLGPVVAREQYGHIGIYGLVSATLGIGTIIGSLLGIRWRPRRPMRSAMLAILIWPPGAILYATGVTLYLVVPITVLGGAGIALFD